jgi:DNA-binding MarR family transcriptional regulator
MSYSIVATPNSLSCALSAIDSLTLDQTVTTEEAAILKSLYVFGWQDGFVDSGSSELAKRLGLSAFDVDSRVDALVSAGAVRRRPLAGGGDVIELATLATPWTLGEERLGWWEYLVVDDGWGPRGET